MRASVEMCLRAIVEWLEHAMTEHVACGPESGRGLPARVRGLPLGHGCKVSACTWSRVALVTSQRCGWGTGARAGEAERGMQRLVWGLTMKR